MKIHEYQAKSILKEYGVPVQQQIVVDDPAAAVEAAKKLGGTVVLKAQVLSGGRGKAGGVKLASSADADEVRKKAEQIMAITVQGMAVKKLLVAPAADIQKELYLALTVDRTAKKITLILSAQGGVEIERLAESDADAIGYLQINPLVGIEEQELKRFIQTLSLESQISNRITKIINRIYRLFIEKDCSLVEINPLAIIKGTEDNIIASMPR